MSVHNEENNINQAIESILNQTYTNFEFLIIDDASEDNSLQILKEYQRLDERINIFKNKENIGLTKSLNILANNSSAPIIARQDADDTSHPNRISAQLNFLINKKLDASTTKAQIMSSGQEINKLSYFIPTKIIIKLKNPFIHGSLMMKKSVFNKLGMYDEKFYYAQDYKLFSDLIKQNFNIKIMNEILYTLNTNNNISSKFSMQQKYFADCVKKNKVPGNENILK
jgi:glycosyltransferase EpsE